MRTLRVIRGSMQWTLLLSTLVVVACQGGGDKAAPPSMTLESPKPGATATLTSGTVLTVNSAPSGASIHVEEEPTPRGTNEARRTTVTLSGTSDSASISLDIALKSDAPASGVIVVIQDPAWPGVPFLLDPASTQSVVATDGVSGLPTTPLAAAASGRSIKIHGNVGPSVSYQFDAIRAVAAASASANECANVSLWDEMASGSGTATPLVVLIHGWQPGHRCNAKGGGDPLVFSRMADYDAVAGWEMTTARLREDYPNSRIVVVRYATERNPSEAGKYILEQLQSDSKVLSSTRVVLIGHSMGGLVARHVAKGWSQLTRAPQLASVITLGTPHFGTPIATSALAHIAGSLPYLETEGSKALKPGTAETQAPLPLAVPLHAMAGVVECSMAGEQRVGVLMGFGLSYLCKASNRQYWTLAYSVPLGIHRVAGTAYSGISDAVVPTSSARADATTVSSRTSLSGSVAHVELQSASAAFTSVSAVAKPYLAAVASVGVGGLSSSVLVGTSLQLTATLFAADNTVLTGRPVTWLSSDPNVASVSSTGAFLAKTAGSTTITATADGRPGVATVDVTAAVMGMLSGRVYDALTSAAIAGASVSLTFISTGGTTTVTTGALGEWSASLAEGAYRISVSAAGYVGTQIVSQTLAAPRTDVEAIPLVPSGRTVGAITGTIRNATDYSGISGALVELRAGMNASSGATVATTTSASTGAYAFNSIAAGVYTVVSRVSGYADGSRTGIVVGGGATSSGQDLSMAPLSSGSEVRVVLTWGATPSDLDSHLTGPISGGSRFHVYYSSKGSCVSSPFACLDRDDLSSYGPETSTIAQLQSGIYRYYVYDFSNGGSSGSTALGNSSARVDVYIGGALRRTYFVPAGTGTLWSVFEYDGTNITTVNTLTTRSASGLPIREGESVDWRTLDEELVGRRTRKP